MCGVGHRNTPNPMSVRASKLRSIDAMKKRIQTIYTRESNGWVEFMVTKVD